MNRLLTTQQFADATGFTRATIADYCRRGLIPGARRASNHAPWRIPESSIHRIGELPDDTYIPPRRTRRTRRKTTA